MPNEAASCRTQAEAVSQGWGHQVYLELLEMSARREPAQGPVAKRVEEIPLRNYRACGEFPTAEICTVSDTSPVFQPAWELIGFRNRAKRQRAVRAEVSLSALLFQEDPREAAEELRDPTNPEVAPSRFHQGPAATLHPTINKEADLLAAPARSSGANHCRGLSVHPPLSQKHRLAATRQGSARHQRLGTDPRFRQQTPVREREQEAP